MFRREKESKPEKLNPRIIVERNTIDGRIRWRVWLNGWTAAGFTQPAKVKIFDSQVGAEKYYADEYGWAKTKEYQPDDQR